VHGVGGTGPGLREKNEETEDDKGWAVTVGELIGKIEGAGFAWITGDRTLKGFPPGILSAEILTAPMVLSPDPDDMAEEKSTMVPDLLTWDGWETRLKEFRRIDGAVAAEGFAIHLQFVERNWLVRQNLTKAL
jgi:hypothetical protein